MKFNIAYPLTGAQKTLDIDDDKRCAAFFDRRMGQEVKVEEQLGEEFRGYTFKIMGGNDKQGFAMKQGVLINGRTRLLLRSGTSVYRPRRTGEMKRKTVRGCIVGKDIRAIFLSITRKGDKDIPGLTDVSNPRRLGPKRANRIRKLFNLKKKQEDNSLETVVPLIKKNAIRRTFTSKSGKQRTKAPKIQRIVTEARLHRKKIYKSSKKEGWLKTRNAGQEYQKFVAEYNKKKAATKAPVVEEKPKKEVKKVETKAKKEAPKKVEAKKDVKPVVAKKDNKKK